MEQNNKWCLASIVKDGLACINHDMKVEVTTDIPTCHRLIFFDSQIEANQYIEYNGFYALYPILKNLNDLETE